MSLWVSRIFWLVVIWTASVSVLGVVAYGIRSMIYTG